MTHVTMDTAAASDIHLGSKRSHVRVLHRIWETLYRHSAPRQFVIVGDFVDHISDLTDGDELFSEQKFNALPKSHRAFMEFLSAVHREGISKVVVIEGNHDRNKRERLIRLRTPYLPYPLVESLRWELAGQTWLAIHGHTLDPEWLHHRWVPELATTVFRGAIERLDTHDGRFSRWVEKRTTTGRRKFLCRLLPPALAAYGATAGADHVIGGHSHEAVRGTRFKLGERAVVSHNCGCWVNDECSWLSVNAAGGVQLHTVEIG